MNRRARNVWVAIAALAMLLVVLALLYRAGSRSELERYKAELREKGEKLTPAELAVPPSTNAEEVAARDLFATNPRPSIDFLLSSRMEFVGPGKARVAWRGNLHWEPLNQAKSVVVGDWAAYERTNELITAVIEKYKSALKRPPPDCGLVYNNTWQIVTNMPRVWISQRVVARELVYAMIGKLHQGRTDAAIEDLHCLVAMTRMERNELTLVHHMIRIAIARLGLGATWEALQAPGWDDRSLKMLQSDWEQVNLIDMMERGMEGERAFSALSFQEVRRRKGAQFWDLFKLSGPAPGAGGKRTEFWTSLWRNEFLASAYKVTSMNDDELLCLRHDSEFIEVLRTLKTNRPASEVETVASNLMKKLDEKFSKDRFHRYLVSAIAIPNFSHAVETAVQGETERRLAITAIAIKRYQLQHGCAPATLAALTPGFLTETPIDPMSGKPLCYRLNSDGSFALYSVGRDGKDDGGKGGLDMWSGPDVVWPSVATAEEADTAEKVALKN